MVVGWFTMDAKETMILGGRGNRPDRLLRWGGYFFVVVMDQHPVRNASHD
jgi:hypothetical protein